MDKLMEILNEARPDLDFTKETKLENSPVVKNEQSKFFWFNNI